MTDRHVWTNDAQSHIRVSGQSSHRHYRRLNIFSHVTFSRFNFLSCQKQSINKQKIQQETHLEHALISNDFY